MLKLGCTLPNLANIFLHSSISAKYPPFTENDKGLFSKFRADMVGTPSIVFTRKTVVNETHIRKSTNICKSIVGIDASHFYPDSRCQFIPTRLYTRYEFNAGLQRFEPHPKKSRNFRNMVMSCFQRMRQDCKPESF